MQVILLQDVSGTGSKGQVVNVSDGFARNFLLPKKLAKPATNDAINAAKRAESAQKHKKSIEKTKAGELAEQLNGQRVELSARAGENGKLFGAITAKEIADALSQQLKIDVDKRNVELNGAIKNLGEHEVAVRLYAETTSKITVNVVAQ